MPVDTPSEAAITRMISQRMARRACSTLRQPAENTRVQTPSQNTSERGQHDLPADGAPRLLHTQATCKDRTDGVCWQLTGSRLVMPGARFNQAPLLHLQVMAEFPLRSPVRSMIIAARAAPITMSRVSATNRPKAVIVTASAMKVCRNL